MQIIGFGTRIAASRIIAPAALMCAITAGTASHLHGQLFGLELHNTLMPASGAMGGTSVARPQDLTSALNGNPASLAQFHGTQVVFSGAWAEPTYNIVQTSNIPVVGMNPFVEPFAGKSTAQGSAGGNIGITQDLSQLGLPATFGLGFVSTGGGFVDFRNFPESNGTNSVVSVSNFPIVLGIDMTERMSMGACLSLGVGLFDGPFVGIGGTTSDYALRGSVGLNYQVSEWTRVASYYQTEQSFRFANAVLFELGAREVAKDVEMDMPRNIGFGIANESLLDGRLLLAADALYKMWNDAELFKSIYDNQWVIQLGSQYSWGPFRFRAGYAWAENPIDQTPGQNIGGVIQPGDLAAVRYTQGQLAITSQHRISGGIGVADVIPGIDLNLMAGGMFRDEEQLGDFTMTAVESYWVGFGLTWRFGRGACERDLAPDSWCLNQP